MKSLIASVSSATLLTAAIIANGFAVDAVSGFSILFASGITGMFVSNYRRVPRCNLERTTGAPARRPVQTGVEFATFATCHTMLG